MVQDRNIAPMEWNAVLINDQTPENIADDLKKIADEWHITDKGTNMVVAIWFNGWKHLPCFTHTSNLVVQDYL